MILGLGVRKVEDTYAIKSRYIKYFDDCDIIFLYPGSEKLFKMCDAFVIIGGDDCNPKLYHEENKGSVDFDDEIDSWEYQIIDYAKENQKALLGICRGLQLINVYFGGSLIQDYPNHRKDTNHDIMLVEPFNDFPEKASVNTHHHQIINRLADEFKVVYRSCDDVIEMIKHESLPIIAVQFHPEMDAISYISQKILKTFYSLI